jgi:hypothetical protein
LGLMELEFFARLGPKLGHVARVDFLRALLRFKGV